MSEQPARICRDLPGWAWLGTKLYPIDTVEGLIARGAELKGRCKTPECRRVVSVDLQFWLAHNHGQLSGSELQRVYQCARVGCDFRMEQPLYEQGYPLACLVGSDATLRVRCRGCSAAREMKPEEMIARLERMGLRHAGNVGIRVVADRIRGSCKVCQEKRWAVEVVSPAAYGTPAYARAQGIAGARS